MAKLTYLQLVNRVLKRDGKKEISNVTSATGEAAIVTELINEAQTTLFNEEDWYSLFTERSITTVAGTNDYALATVAADGANFGRGISLTDETNNNVLRENFIRQLDKHDPDMSSQGTPSWFTIENDNYRLDPTPAGIYTLRDRFWAEPATLSANTSTSDLPKECEVCIIYYASRELNIFTNNVERVISFSRLYDKSLNKAKIANSNKIAQMLVFHPDHGHGFSAGLVRFPPEFGHVGLF